MKVKIKKFHEDARIPEKAYEGDFCYDVYAVSEEEVAPNVWKYGIGWGLQIERDKEPVLQHTQELFEKLNSVHVTVDLRHSPMVLSIDMRPRSSVWETGMILSNCQGTIDEGYCDEISAVFYHVMPNMPRYKVGEKIAQLKIGITFPIDFVEVEEFEDTERGLRGYGSSGK